MIEHQYLLKAEIIVIVSFKYVYKKFETSITE